jgi:phage protein D
MSEGHKANGQFAKGYPQGGMRRRIDVLERERAELRMVLRERVDYIKGYEAEAITRIAALEARARWADEVARPALAAIKARATSIRDTQVGTGRLLAQGLIDLASEPIAAYPQPVQP